MMITISRMLFVPVIVGFLIPDQIWMNVTAALLFMAASVTDYFDGFYARKYNAVSNMGKFMDPIADKVLVTSILVMLSAAQKIDPLMVIVILARDTLIGGLRSVAAADGIVIDAKSAGKWKTALQMVAIPAVMIEDILWGHTLWKDRLHHFVDQCRVKCYQWMGVLPGLCSK
jgi:CDP-diacylglycerol--glycerol-3-phosphate 3-phosphatidyltransferase